MSTEMEIEQSPKLLQHAEGVLPAAAHPHLIACCPTMDLVAFVTTEEQVQVYRFGGQRVFNFSKKNGIGKVVSLGWKFNGQLLAVCWSTGDVDALSSETGKPVNQFRQSAKTGEANADVGRVSSFGWGLNFIDVNSVKTKIGPHGANSDGQDNPFTGLTSDNWDDQKESNTSLDDFLERIPDAGKVEIPLDLPEQLARFDISGSLVKPPALPMLPPAAHRGGSYSNAELFSSQVSLDAALNTNSLHSVNGLEALVLASDEGGVELVLYDVLHLGSVTWPTEWRLPRMKFKRCAYHPFSCTYMFLVEFEKTGTMMTALLPLSMHFMRTSGNQLHLIESKTAHLQLLLKYMGQALHDLEYQWTHAKELPTKFMANIDEELGEKNEPNLAQSLFHLAATGDCPPTIKEWLVDILAERNHKRWDHAVTHGYTEVRKITHTSILPALDRCVALLTHLRGLAMYYEDSRIMDVPISLFDGPLVIVRCMRLLAHHVLLYYSEETQQFTTFSKWLRREIDIQAAQNPPNPNEEVEQDMGFDYSLLFSYLQGPLQASKLDLFVKRDDSAAPISASATLYEDLKKALNEFKAGDHPREELLSMNKYFEEWERINQKLNQAITRQQLADSTIADAIILEQGETVLSEVVMLDPITSVSTSSKSTGGTGMVTSMAASVFKTTSNQVNICLISHDADYHSIASVKSIAATLLRFESQCRVLALKIVDNGVLVLLLQDNETCHILIIPIVDDLSRLHIDTSINVMENLVPDGRPLQSSRALNEINETEMRQYIKHTFDSKERFKPTNMEVNARKNRRVAIVIGEDCRQTKILDLDYKAGDEKIDSLERNGGEDNHEKMDES